MNPLNALEVALLDTSGEQLDFYLEMEKTVTIMQHIQEIRQKAAVSTEAGRLKERVLQALRDD